MTNNKGRFGLPARSPDLWVMERVLCRLRMPDQPLYTAELGSHDQPCLSPFSQGKHGHPIAAYRRNMNNKGTASPCLGLGRQATRKATLGADAPSQGGTGLFPLPTSLQTGCTSKNGAPNAVILSLRRISRGDPDVLFSRHEIGTDGSSCGAVSFEIGEWWHDAGWRVVRFLRQTQDRLFASSG